MELLNGTIFAMASVRLFSFLGTRRKLE